MLSHRKTPTAFAVGVFCLVNPGICRRVAALNGSPVRLAWPRKRLDAAPRTAHSLEERAPGQALVAGIPGTTARGGARGGRPGRVPCGSARGERPGRPAHGGLPAPGDSFRAAFPARPSAGRHRRRRLARDVWGVKYYRCRARHRENGGSGERRAGDHLKAFARDFDGHRGRPDAPGRRSLRGRLVPRKNGPDDGCCGGEQHRAMAGAI